MALFFWHPNNPIATKMREFTGKHAFEFSSRGHLELTLQNLISQAGYDVWSSCHFVIGSAGSIDKYIRLNPDDPIDARALLYVKAEKPWHFIKIVNGPTMQDCIGYVSIGGAPMSMTNAEMAQKGIISATYVPRPL